MTLKILLLALLTSITLSGCYVHDHDRSWLNDRHEHSYGRHNDQHRDYQRDRRGDNQRDHRNRYR